MQPPYENPAQRLNVTLGLLAAQPQQRTVRHALSEVFGLPEDNSLELIMGVASIVELSRTVELRVSTSPSELRSRWIGPVHTCLLHLSELDRSLSLAMHPVSEAVRLSLEACAELFPPSADQTDAITAERLRKASRLADEILDELAAAGLDPASHELLTRQILALQNSLKLFRVVGQSGFYDAILSVHAALAVTGTRKDRPWYKQIRENLSTMADLVQITEGAQKMIEGL